MILLPPAEIGNVGCPVTQTHVDQRYLAAELPQANAFVTVLTYKLNFTSYCDTAGANDRVITVLNVIEPKARQQRMVSVKAEEMSEQITAKGSVALYGI